MNLIQSRIIEEAAACGMSELQLNAILGSLMGDASIPKPKTAETARLRWNHSWKQIGYARHKYETLKPFATGEPRRRENPGFGDEWAVLTLKSSKLLRLIHSIVYPHDGPRRMAQDLLELITHPMALAWLFLDNGSRAQGHNCGDIAQNGFPEEDVDRLIDWMEKCWGIRAVKRRVHHSSTGKESCIVSLPVRAYVQLMGLIEPYVPESMRYKTELVMSECPVCGSKFPKGRHKCCSPACAQLIRKERTKQYYSQNYDRIAEKCREWKASHRDQVNAAARRAYRNLSPEQRKKHNEYANAYRARNLERVRKMRRDYYRKQKNDSLFIKLRKGQNHRHYQRVKEDPARHEHMLELQRQRRKRPEVRAKEMDAQRRYRASVNADSMKKAAQLERDRLAWRKYMQKLREKTEGSAQEVSDRRKNPERNGRIR